MKDNEYKYTTIDAINLLMEDETIIFEYPVPNHIGLIRLVRTQNGICFYQKKDNRKIVCEPIALSNNTLKMTWKKINNL